MKDEELKTKGLEKRVQNLEDLVEKQSRELDDFKKIVSRLLKDVSQKCDIRQHRLLRTLDFIDDQKREIVEEIDDLYANQRMITIHLVPGA